MLAKTVLSTEGRHPYSISSERTLVQLSNLWMINSLEDASLKALVVVAKMPLVERTLELYSKLALEEWMLTVAPNMMMDSVQKSYDLIVVEMMMALVGWMWVGMMVVL